MTIFLGHVKQQTKPVKGHLAGRAQGVDWGGKSNCPPFRWSPWEKWVKNKSTIFLSFLLTMKKVSFRTPLGHGLRSHYRPFASTETPGASARVGKLTDRKQSPRFLGRAPRSIRIPLSTPQHHFMLTCSKTAKREPIPHHDVNSSPSIARPR